jgi:hypothetical protein
VSVGAEDPQKIQKLVHSNGQLQRWNDLYKDSLKRLISSGVMSVVDDEHVEINLDESTRDELRRRLPLHVQQRYVSTTNNLHQSLTSIVAPAARNQTIKGVVTAGIIKSGQYALDKLKKGILKS